MKPKKILVTGGTGFIGSHVVRELTKTFSCPIRVLHLPNDSLVNLESLDVELIEGDVRHLQDVEHAMEGCDVVFHLAALFSFWNAMGSQMHDINVEGTRKVFDTALRNKVKTLIYTSSITVFGGDRELPANESTSFRLGNIHSVYVKSKHDAHNLAKQYQALGLDLRIAVPTLPIGPGDYGPTPTGQMFLDLIRRPVQVVFDSMMNFIDVRDCAKAHVEILRVGAPCETYILSGQNMTYEGFIEKMNGVLDISPKQVFLPDGALDVAAALIEWFADRVTMKSPVITRAEIAIARSGLAADCTKAKQQLGLQNRPIETSIVDALRWYVEHDFITKAKVIESLSRYHQAS